MGITHVKVLFFFCRSKEQNLVTWYEFKFAVSVAPNLSIKYLFASAPLTQLYLLYHTVPLPPSPRRLT